MLTLIYHSDSFNHKKNNLTIIIYNSTIVSRTVHGLSLPLCNLFATISFLQDLINWLSVYFLLNINPEFSFPVVVSPITLQFIESSTLRVKPQSVTVGDIGAVLGTVRLIKE